MQIYFIVIFVIVVFGYLSNRFRDSRRMSKGSEAKCRSNKICVFCIVFTLVFVSAFRFRVGADFNNYYRYSKVLNWVADFEENPFVEWGVGIFALFNQKFFPGTDGVFIIVAGAATMMLFSLTIEKYSENLTLSFLLFVFAGVFTGSFNGVRQYLAAAILFAGYRFVVDRKFIKWLLVVLLASGFHITAVVMLFAYFLTTQRPSIKLFAIYALIGVTFYLSYDRIFDALGFMRKQEFIVSEYTTRSVNRLRVLVQCVPLMLPLFTGIDAINEDRFLRALYNISVLNAVLAVAGMNSTYLSRFNIYTNSFLVLMYPAVLNRTSRQKYVLFMPLLIMCYFVYWYYETSTSWDINNFQWVFGVRN